MISLSKLYEFFIHFILYLYRTTKIHKNWLQKQTERQEKHKERTELKLHNFLSFSFLFFLTALSLTFSHLLFRVAEDTVPLQGRRLLICRFDLLITCPNNIGKGKAKTTDKPIRFLGRHNENIGQNRVP